jgi:hypothetical protein
MSLLVIRVLYLLFDAAANGLVWLLHQCFGVRPEQLAWLVGEYREEKGEEAGEDGSRDGTADRSTALAGQAQT